MDLKLRQDMQYELIRLKNELGITFIYVTHDQEEAFAMSDRVVVMNQGRIEQIGTPQEIYEEPSNLYVARFVGEINILPARIHVRARRGHLYRGHQRPPFHPAHVAPVRGGGSGERAFAARGHPRLCA